MIVRRMLSAAVLLGLAVFLCFFAGPSVTSTVDAHSTRIIPVAREVDDARAELQKIEPPTRAFVLISKIVRPSVVTVLTKAKIRGEIPRFFWDDDDWPLPSPFRQPRRRQQPRQYEREVQGMGSGFFVDAKGDILTNNHVVQGAHEIKVHLADGSSYDAEIVGRDPKSDIAVIRVKDCPAAKIVPARLGDSDALEPGDWVIAIGAPFGLTQSVSAGIVSAKGRSNVNVIPEKLAYRYQDFIQTDAAINRGNSGGPLVNYKAEVIGINTAIASQTGAYQGVGFAIPSNMAKKVMAKLIKSGRIVRGYLGVLIGDVTEEAAEKLKLSNRDGVLVARVLPETPAEKAGLRVNDVIIAIDKTPTPKTKLLRQIVADTKPGTQVKLRVIRDGKTIDLPLTIELQPGDTMPAAEAQRDDELGITLETLTEDTAAKLAVADKVGVYKGRQGVLVTEVVADTPADRAGIQAMDLIYKVAGKRVTNTDEYFEARKGLKLERGILIEKRTGDVAKRVLVR